ncbi:MAG: prepilin-type N-terminal cleavage/methylation domain-containing protein [Verrucomicrobia bacterium]|jgi:prepilin-type N-terminal cleavage/methylation domain-containing protein/prepilin-type processing-associated H-X9-DG protein|nr:prepilin-type N-terminal cleavage/methylation domain-containing protein [Verrucomicrobiota bacterium]
MNKLPPLPPRHRPSGFTLIELLVVIAVIGVLASILIPAISSVRAKSYQSTTVSNLRQLQAANEMYANEHGGRYAEAVPWDHEANARDYDSAWFMNPEFMQYLGYSEDSNLGWDGEQYPDIAKTGIPGLVFDSEKTDSQLTIAMNIGDKLQWASTPLSYKKNKIIDPARSMAFGDGGGFWARFGPGTNWTNDNDGRVTTSLAFRHGGKAAVVYFDGSTDMVTKEEVEDDRDFWLPNKR